MPARASLTTILLLFVTLFIGVDISYAEGAKTENKRGGLEIVPAFVEVELTKPGEKAQVPISLTNQSDTFISLELFPIDFKQKDGSGAISFVGQKGAYSYSLSSFLSFQSRDLELAPGEKKEIVVTVTNRQDLSPGGHYAAVVAKLLPEKNVQNPVAPSLSSLILVRKVGGEQFNLSLKDVNFPHYAVAFSIPQSVVMQFQNEGNIHLVPYGRIEVKDMLGRLLYDGSINTASLRVFPSSRRDIAVRLNQLGFALPVSFMTMEIKGQDSLKKTTFVRSESFLYISPIFLAIIVLLCITLYRLKKRFKKSKNVLKGVKQAASVVHAPKGVKKPGKRRRKI